jgi:serine/threonine-protein kinase PpkA
MIRLLCRMLPVVLALMTAMAWAADRPLLMDGKKTLFQRVLTVPDARLYSAPDTAVSSEAVVPFSVYYVYQRNGDWLQVGVDSYGKIDGWIQQSSSIVWNQALTVSFRDPQETQRVLMFDNKDALQQLVEDNDQEAYARLYQQAVKNERIKDNPVIAIQPEAHVDIRENFYLVPIKRHEDVYLGNEQARLLQIASVPLDSRATVGGRADTATAPAQKSRAQYRSGIHFVIDSTVSMGPYIDRTREAVRKVYNGIARQGLVNKVNFGLTAFRDNIDVVPGLDYLTRTFVTLEQGADEQRFFSLVNTLEPSDVSSRDYREDAYAGIKAAIENTNWNDYDARYIVLITDAGPREHHDSLGATRLSGKALRQLAYDKGISIWVLHLRADSPTADHERAEKLYRQLSFYPGIGDFYYGVDVSDGAVDEFSNVGAAGSVVDMYQRPDERAVNEFGTVLEALTNQITQQVLATSNGVLPIPIPEQNAQVVAVEAVSPQLEQLQSKVARLGNALRMQYLQREAGKPLPKVFDAWMIDRDFSDPSRSAVDVRVLLTRDQLSDLKTVMQQVLDLAEEGVLTPSGFLNDLKSLAASVSRDPSSVAGSISRGGGNLAEMGYMREYIEDLPYTGEVMNLSLTSWEEWSAKEQIEFMHRLESKINYYQALHDHTDLWVTPGGGPVNGNSVFPVVLNLLP